MFAGDQYPLARLSLFSSPLRAYNARCQGTPVRFRPGEISRRLTVNIRKINTCAKMRGNSRRIRTYKFSALKPLLESALAEISGGGGPRRTCRDIAHMPANYLESQSCIKTPSNSHGITLLQKKVGGTPHRAHFHCHSSRRSQSRIRGGSGFAKSLAMRTYPPANSRYNFPSRSEEAPAR